MAPRSDLRDRARNVAQRALRVLGVPPEAPPVHLPTAIDRPTRQVLRAGVATGFGSRDVVVRVVLDPDHEAADSFGWEHRVARVLGDVADGLVRDGTIGWNPVVPVLHAEPVDLGDALATVCRFVPGSRAPLTAARWGQTLAVLHTIGSTRPALGLLRTRPVTNVLAGLSADGLLAALERPGHPFRHDTWLAVEFARALRERALRAVQLDPVPLLAHRDLHALNCVNALTGPLAIDWQESGWGSRSDDFAWLHLQVTRFAGPTGILQNARRAYARAGGGTCPTAEQIEAAGQVRELLCLGFSIQNADRSPMHLRECLTELPVLTDPGARTATWRLLFNPAVFRPGLVA
jgi:hypothetical protein